MSNQPVIWRQSEFSILRQPLSDRLILAHSGNIPPSFELISAPLLNVQESSCIFPRGVYFLFLSSTRALLFSFLKMDLDRPLKLE